METKNVYEILKSPSKIIRAFNKIGMLQWISDESYIKWRYKVEFDRNLNLKNPTTFNEKLHWLKLYDRNPLYPTLVDKLEVRNYISKTIGEDHLIPLLGVWEKAEDIKWDDLPEKFVLKCTHDSGSVIVCDDKSKNNRKETIKKLNRALKLNYYYAGREWAYVNIQPRIIAEKYLNQGDHLELRDYRCFCFNGEPHFFSVDLSINDKSKTRRNLYDLNWNLIDAEITYPNETELKVEKPSSLNLMTELSRKLSRELPFSRVDFYFVDNQVYFGEITLYHQNGLGHIRPESFDKYLGELIKLPNT